MHAHPLLASAPELRAPVMVCPTPIAGTVLDPPLEVCCEKTTEVPGGRGYVT